MLFFSHVGDGERVAGMRLAMRILGSLWISILRGSKNIVAVS